MGVFYRFLEAPSLGDGSEVLRWFASLDPKPRQIPTEYGWALHFESLGPIALDEHGKVNSDSLPVVTVHRPIVRRGILWTVGEVHFVPAGLRKRFPSLERTRSGLLSWLREHECVFSRRADSGYDYYLEGCVRNFGSPGSHGEIFALPSGFAALKAGQYFVDRRDTETLLEMVCRKLRLRGCECSG